MTLTPDQLTTIEEEKNILSSVLSSLQRQVNYHASRLRSEADRARELTSSLVAARRAEDKQMMASDEAVSHALKDRKEEELATLGKLMEKPYFARIVIEEEVGDDFKEREYRIGFQANPECRIIDWRKAPISKLYYQYKEGDDFSEEIQGQERSGRVLLRNRVEIDKGEVHRISCRHGELQKTSEGWRAVMSPGRSRTGGDYNKLPPVLSLITAEQFRAITEDVETAVLIQGIAGSGKTTVALHRLSWLLHENNSDLSPEECVVIVLSPSLQAYIQSSLPELQIDGMRVLTYKEWAGQLLELKKPFARPVDTCGSSVNRVKRSMALLKALEEFIAKGVSPITSSPIEAAIDILLKVLQHPADILRHDETKLIDADLIARTRQRFLANREKGVFDEADDALILRVHQLFAEKQGRPRKRYRHVVVDEVQDLGPSQLATVIGSVEALHQLTLVGDVAQNLDESGSFPGWEKLMQHWQFGSDMSRYLTLEVSHRSTLPIMKFAEHVQGKSTVKDGRQGRVPIWFRCGKESRGIAAIIDWLGRAVEKYPGALTAVLCRDRQEAKYAYSVLAPTFGPTVRLGDESSFSLEEGIVVSEIRQVKGLEFCNVLLWNPSSKSYGTSSLERNLLYVGITRAEENLCLVSWSRPSKLLPSPTSNLVRYLDLRLEEEVEA